MRFLKKILFLLFISIGLAACSTSNESVTTQDKYNEAPPFKLNDLEGKTHQLSDYHGQKVYIKFWASWCPICLSGMSELNDLAGETDADDFTVLTIVSPNANGEKDTESFKKWFSHLNNAENIKVLLDEGGEVTNKFTILGYPTSVYINTEGELVKIAPGHYSNEQIKQEIKNMN